MQRFEKYWSKINEEYFKLRGEKDYDQLYEVLRSKIHKREKLNMRLSLLKEFYSLGSVDKLKLIRNTYNHVLNKN